MMSGETDAQVSGWTVDTLREHTLQKIGDLRDSTRQRIEDDREFITGKIIDSRDMLRLQILDNRASVQQQFEDIRTLFGQQILDLRTLLNERYDTQTKALDAAFKAAEQAVQTALVSAEKAVGKAETAADKRFESVNEFRQQLADQTATFPTRIEVSTRMDGISADLARAQTQLTQAEQRISNMEVRSGSVDQHRTNQRLDNGQIVAYVIAIVAILSLVFSHVKL
jgi:hypothetical protein